MIGDYHLGYQQLAGINWVTFSEYIQHFINEDDPTKYKNFYAGAWDDYENSFFQAAWDDLNLNKRGNFECTEFPKWWGLTEQKFFHALYVADQIKGWRKAVSYTHLTLPTICSV